MSLSEAFDQPVVYKENGLDLTLPKLDLDDHAKWCAEIHAARKPLRLKAIPGNLPPAERARQIRAVEFDEPTLDDISDLLYTPTGIKTALEKSLEKAGVTDAAERAKTVKRIKPHAAQRLAMDISGLFEKKPILAEQQGGANPLTGAGESTDPTSTSTTGDGPGSSSPST